MPDLYTHTSTSVHSIYTHIPVLPEKR
jgi:hypothetical protein